MEYSGEQTDDPVLQSTPPRRYDKLTREEGDLTIHPEHSSEAKNIVIGRRPVQVYDIFNNSIAKEGGQ